MTSFESEMWGDDELSLLETLDHVLNRGLVIAGEVTISVANVDLLFVGLNVVLGTVETIDRTIGAGSGSGQERLRPAGSGIVQDGGQDEGQ